MRNVKCVGVVRVGEQVLKRKIVKRVFEEGRDVYKRQVHDATGVIGPIRFVTRCVLG